MACSNGKPSKKTDKTEETPQPGITEFVVNEEIHNFGEIISGEIIVCTFTLTNTGNNNLDISKIEEGCGCLAGKNKKHTCFAR